MGRPRSIILVNTSYQKKAKEFLDHLLMLGHSEHGAGTKHRYVQDFLHYAESNAIQEIKLITASLINDFYNYTTQRPNKKTGEELSLKTSWHYMRSIELFFMMLQSAGEVEINPTATLKFPYPVYTGEERTALTQEEVKLLYHHCNSYQERAILSLAYGCGLRVGELVSCNIEDIKLREGLLIVPAGKFNKRRVVPMSKGVIEDVSNYFYHDRIYTEAKDIKAYMLHSKGGRMQKDTYNKYLKRIIQRTGSQSIIEKDITIHNLRHSIATHLLEEKMPLEQVRMFLGHSQLETTEIYTHISEVQLKELINANP